ncbi:(deoxy)nucleoside triphosphate pyrophosphohydrolase [Pedobacter duraquae]|uniref:8-oxo-dGTP diphosphatase n=1 Tax=Pedobacter duraquae TaxID=425511 RepID=A0A4R6IAY1_9SPHI|nr:(deoxy)nucleoside triphosphate pyrophosphohydrolase [Pedobacter duraquae]TDO19360.1 8-oxo-dGTP diphosphatase [Pedobacter duraquae]
MIFVSCAIIENSNGQVLATRRSEAMSLPMKWEFAGGKVEHGETYDETILRKIKEELGIETKVSKQLKVVISHYPNFSITLIPFICRYVNGEILLHEHHEFTWLTANKLLSLDWAAADIPVVHQYLSSLQI